MDYRINIFLPHNKSPCITFFVSCANLINFSDLEKIEIIKKKRLYAAQLLKEFMKNPYHSYGGGGDEAPLNTEHAEEIRNIKSLKKGKIYIKQNKIKTHKM
jgi:hypothetical protein